MKERLKHYSYVALGELVSKEQEACTSYFGKPRGLWVSVEGDQDWREFCLSENFGSPEKWTEYDVILNRDAKVLWLRSATGLDEFTRRYGISDGVTLYGSLLHRSSIDWPTVAKEYQGIVIAPYQWSRRMDDFTGWYYGWDCASGCIWDASAIEKVVEVAKKMFGANRAEGGTEL